MKKNVFAVIALIAVLALVLTGCGKKDSPAAPEKLPDSGELGLGQVELSAYAWSSNNGATVSVKAAPSYYADGMTAQFVIRVEGEDVENVECVWDNGFFCAEADLNAEDGLCYYVVLTAPNGEEKQVEVNTPANPVNEDYINLAHALETYCNLEVTDFSFDGSSLTVTTGSAQIVLPRIAQNGQLAKCEKAELVLSHNESEIDRKSLTLADDVGNVEVSGVHFAVPALEDDEQLHLALEVTLADGQTLTAPGCTWFYNNSQLLPAVG